MLRPGRAGNVRKCWEARTSVFQPRIQGCQGNAFFPGLSLAAQAEQTHQLGPRVVRLEPEPLGQGLRLFSST